MTCSGCSEEWSRVLLFMVGAEERGKVVTTRWPDPSEAPSGVDLGFPRNH